MDIWNIASRLPQAMQQEIEITLKDIVLRITNTTGCSRQGSHVCRRFTLSHNLFIKNNKINMQMRFFAMDDWGDFKIQVGFKKSVNKRYKFIN